MSSGSALAEEFGALAAPVYVDFSTLPSTSVGEIHFGDIGPLCCRQGWAVFPQERNGRKPGVVDGEMLKWSKYQDAGPDLATVERWSRQAWGLNVAAIMGEASAFCFTIDVDVTDVDLSEDIQLAAARTLGETKFQRIGNWPKIALIYRVASRDELPPNRTLTFLDADGEKASEDAVEFQGQGKAITIHGRHHKTGERFVWPTGKMPMNTPPAFAPLVDAKMIEDFVDAIQAIRPFHRNTFLRADVETIGYVETDGVNVPKIRQLSGGGGSDWIEEDGLVVNGREKFLWMLAYQTARANPGACGSDDGAAKIMRIVFDEFRSKALCDGRWSGSHLDAQVREKVQRACRLVVDGKVSPARVRKEKPSERLARKKAGEKPDNSMAFMRERNKQAVEYADVTKLPKEVEADKKRWALEPVRTKIAEEVGAGIDAALESFFSDVYRTWSEGETPPVHLLQSPTGSGKTSKTMKLIATDPRTKQYDHLDPEESPGPIAMLLPTYANIDELRLKADVLNLDAGLDDAELAAQALERNLFPESEMEARLADLRRDAAGAGVRTMIYKGKKAAGCRMVEKLDMLMAAGIGSAGLCKAKVKTPEGETEDSYCEHYSTCEAIAQRREIAKCHVVFLPHAFLTLSIPEELQRVRAVIADERVFHLFVHTASFLLDTLNKPRKVPKLTKKERDEGKVPEELLDDRNRAATKVVDALLSNQCPANVMLGYKETFGGKTMEGLQYVQAAKRVCGNAITADQNVTPDMPLDLIRDLCSKPTGVQIGEEYRFWKIVEERLEVLKDDGFRAGLAAHARNPGHAAARPNACGAGDYRLQYIKEDNDDGSRTEKIRMSWRTKPNWEGRPILLLDASASPDIVRKLFGGRDVRVHSVDAPLNVRTVAAIDRTYSNMAVVAKGGTVEERKDAARVKALVQSAISTTSAAFGFGRVVVGTSAVVRKAVNTNWAAPSNVDFTHYGAMRGLDFAKNHVAALSVGRMEIPIQTVDGLVAALTYDDPEPEEPFDFNGDGVGPDGGVLRLPIENRRIPMRSGEEITVGIPVYPGRWARIVQAQYREEELKQFLGRLRPVYRSGEAPIWIAISKVVPEGVVVDEVVGLQDLVAATRGSRACWDAVRRTDGVVHPDLLEEVDPMGKGSPDRWAADLKLLGFDFEEGRPDASNRNVAGFRPVRIRRGRNKVHVYVRSERTDPSEAVRRAFHDILDETVEVLKVGEPVKPVMKGTSRTKDAVEIQLKDIKDRLVDEGTGFLSAARWFFGDAPADAYRYRPSAAEGKLPVFASIRRTGHNMGDPVFMEEVVAFEGTEAMWERQRALIENQAAPEILSSSVVNPDEDESAMGNGVDDLD